MQISNKNLLAVRKSCSNLLGQIGFTDPEKYEPHRLSFDELQRHTDRVYEAARGAVDLIKEDGTPQEVRETEAAYNGLREILDALNGEKRHRENAQDRSARKFDGDPRRPFEDRSGPAVDPDGGTPFYRNEADTTTGLRPEQRMADHLIDNGSYESHNLSAGQYLRAMVLGAKNDVEKRALAEGTDSAGGYSVPDILSSQMIDLMRAQSTVIRAGATTVPLTSDTSHIAKVATDPVPAWRNEAASVAESDPTFTRVTFAPKSLAVLVKVSRELLEDSLNIERVLPQIMTAAMAVELDRVTLFGSGSDPEPKGVVNFTGCQEVTHDAALTSYAPMIAARTLVKTANHPGLSAFVMHPRDDGALAGLVDGNGQPLMVPPAISGIPMLTSTSVPDDEGVGTDESTIVTGDFKRLMIGLRHGVTIQILKERFQDTGQYGFIAFMRADVQAEYENAFCKITGITVA